MEQLLVQGAKSSWSLLSRALYSLNTSNFIFIRFCFLLWFLKKHLENYLLFIIFEKSIFKICLCNNIYSLVVVQWRLNDINSIRRILDWTPMATRIWAIAFGSFARKGSIRGFYLHPRIRSVSLIDSGLTFFLQKKTSITRYYINVIWLIAQAITKFLGFEWWPLSHPTPHLTVTKISTYNIHIYIFITVRTTPQLNCLSRTVQTAVTNHNLNT